MRCFGRGAPLGQSSATLWRRSPAQGVRRLALPAALLSLVIVVGLPSALSAADIRLTPTLDVSEEYATNVDLDPKGEEDSALTTRITPGAELRITSPRITAALDAGVIVRHQSGGEDEGVDADVDLAGTGDVEVVRDHFFIETGASISQQVLASDLANSASNQEMVQTYRLAPVFRTRLGSYATGELRYGFEQVILPEEASDQTTHRGSFDVSSGRKFDRFRGSLTGGMSESLRAGDGDVSRSSIDASGEYAFSRAVHLLAAVGYQSFDDNSSTSFDGPTWRVGARLRPGRRMELEADYGERDDDTNFSARLNYDIGPRTQFTFGYSETLSTSQERLARTLSFAEVNADSDQIVDERDETPFNPKTDPFDIDDETERIKTFRAMLRGNWGRNTASVAASYAEEEKLDSGEEETNIRFDLGWSRRLSRHLTLNSSLGYEHIEFDDGQEDDEYLASAGLNYQIQKNVSAYFSYFFRTQDSTSPASEFTDHRLTVGLRLQL